MERELRCCYFADYEVIAGDHFRSWGQVVFDYHVDDASRFDPSVVLVGLRRAAADARGVEPDLVRLRSVHRLL